MDFNLSIAFYIIGGILLYLIIGIFINGVIIGISSDEGGAGIIVMFWPIVIITLIIASLIMFASDSGKKIGEKIRSRRS